MNTIFSKLTLTTEGTPDNNEMSWATAKIVILTGIPAEVAVNGHPLKMTMEGARVLVTKQSILRRAIALEQEIARQSQTIERLRKVIAEEKIFAEQNNLVEQ
ncbi:MAG: hypothetical protein Q7R93_01415 [bacterium]|nr:hypothetical protein [bacterium]